MEESDRTKYLIIHGHFYQPPRENPWTERIDRQEKAAPWHDWNERITYECYKPNTRSRRLDWFGRVSKLVNNYEWTSFNFGPTLFSYLEQSHPDVYRRIIDADRASGERLGHGNAIAQVYNHVIMPLASPRDQETQIRWGVHDFRRRFGRDPEGIWLAETAINETTVEILIDHGFRFIILSPHQAERVRPVDRSTGWEGVADGSIRTGRPYRCYGRTRTGRRSTKRFIDVFFYDGRLSVDVSFNHLLRDGENFSRSIEGAYGRSGGDLVTIATDGEVYGHHEPFADMALAYLIDRGAPSRGIEMVNFGAYLDTHEPAMEVLLKAGPNGEGTAWSCSHGVGRWKENCGCSTGAPAGWNQEWRGPLRDGLGSLRDGLAVELERAGSELFADPWRARDEYIEVIEERSPEFLEAFVARHAKRELAPEERLRAASLLEAQRHAQLMFTSCGWFFNDISGIETVQIMLYAARAVELAGRAGPPLGEKLLADLGRARSNVPSLGTGADIYRRAVAESAIDLPFIVGQYSITSYLHGAEEASQLFRYRITPRETMSREGERLFATAALVEIVSPFTLERRDFLYMLVVENDAGFSCLVGEPQDGETYGRLVRDCLADGPLPPKDELLRLAGRHCTGRRFELRDLFREDRESILRGLAARKIDDLEHTFIELFENYKELLELMKEGGLEPPQSLLAPAVTALTRLLETEIERWGGDQSPGGMEGIRKILADAARYGVPVETRSASNAFTALVIDRLHGIGLAPVSGNCAALRDFVALCDELGIVLDETEIQNELYDVLTGVVAPAVGDLAGSRPPDALAALGAFLDLARRFNFDVDELGSRIEP